MVTSDLGSNPRHLKTAHGGHLSTVYAFAIFSSTQIGARKPPHVGVPRPAVEGSVNLLYMGHGPV